MNILGAYLAQDLCRVCSELGIVATRVHLQKNSEVGFVDVWLFASSRCLVLRSPHLVRHHSLECRVRIVT